MSLSQVQTDESRYDLEILDFRGRNPQESLRALTDLFALDGDQAKRYYQALPLTLFDGQPESAIRTCVQVLVALGADVRITRTGTEDSWILVAETEVVDPSGHDESTAAFTGDESDPTRWAGPVPDGADDTEPAWMPSQSRDDRPSHVEAIDAGPFIDIDLSETMRLLETEIGRVRATEQPDTPNLKTVRAIALEQRLSGAQLRSNNLRAYYPPDCSPDKHTWVDSIPTVQFFAQGLRKLREAAASVETDDDF